MIVQALQGLAFVTIVVVVVEKAVAFHATLFWQIALGLEQRPAGPPLLRPRWRLALYAVYFTAGLFAVLGRSTPAVVFTVAALAVLVLADLTAIVRGSRKRTA